jgi:hypothetical protein
MQADEVRDAVRPPNETEVARKLALGVDTLVVEHASVTAECSAADSGWSRPSRAGITLERDSGDVTTHQFEVKEPVRSVEGQVRRVPVGCAASEPKPVPTAVVGVYAAAIFEVSCTDHCCEGQRRGLTLGWLRQKRRTQDRESSGRLEVATERDDTRGRWIEAQTRHFYRRTAVTLRGNGWGCPARTSGGQSEGEDDGANREADRMADDVHLTQSTADYPAHILVQV